jgi:hypothetical protein
MQKLHDDRDGQSTIIDKTTTVALLPGHHYSKNPVIEGSTDLRTYFLKPCLVILQCLYKGLPPSAFSVNQALVSYIASDTNRITGARNFLH